MTSQELHIHKINQARKAAGKDHWAPMDCTVKAFLSNLEKALVNVDQAA